MKQFNIDLHSEFVQRSTVELEKLLDKELGKKTPDDDVVLTLLHILKDREPELPLQLSDREEEAAKHYQQKQRKSNCRTRFSRRFLSLVASFILILTLFFAIAPQKAEEETFWEMLQRLTSSVLEYIAPRELLIDAETKYVFKTDNAGLQQVYDAVVQLGITEPVVPMWLPEGCELTELQLLETPMTKTISARFSHKDNGIVYRLNLYSGEPAHQYYKGDTHYESHEWNGYTYHITKNNDRWVVVWEKEKIECSFTVDCQEDTLRRILNSIYVTEDD